MVQACCRLWNLTVGVLVVVVMVNLLTMQLLHSTCEVSPGGALLHQQYLSQPPQVPPPPAPPPHPPPPPINGSGSHFRFRKWEGRWDQRRQYRIHDFVVSGDDWEEVSRRAPVCLATQTSLERLHWLVQVADHWSGPISLALFAPDLEFALAQHYVSYLRTCFPAVRSQVSFHVVYPSTHPPLTSLELGSTKLPCDKVEWSLRWLLHQRPLSLTRWRESLPYPQNHLRNVARKNCQAAQVFLTDVDVVPSLGMFPRLASFLAAAAPTCARCAYVVPTYELFERAAFPENKSRLLQLAAKGQARPFHHKVFIHNQFATNFSRWEESSLEGPVKVSHDVTDFEFLYEPFYVAPDQAPPHDERFVGYGFTRNTQVYEMYVQGFRFRVLTPVFTVHWGLQKKRGRPPWRERQNAANRRLFETFKREVAARYGRDPLRMLPSSSAKNKTPSRRKAHP